MNSTSRVVSGVALATAWVATKAAPRIADLVMPEPSSRMPQVLAATGALEFAFAGALTLGVLALCAWLMFGGRKEAENAT